MKLGWNKVLASIVQVFYAREKNLGCFQGSLDWNTWYMYVGLLRQEINSLIVS